MENGESQNPTPQDEATQEVTAVSFEDVAALDEGTYRVTFENRTTWTAELRYVEDADQDELVPVLHYIDPEKEERNREFPLVSGDEGGVVATTKPNWGLLTKINPKGERVAAVTADEPESETDEPSLEGALDESLAAIAKRDE